MKDQQVSESAQRVTPELRFSALLRQLRAAQGLSQRDLADRMASLGHSAWRQSTVAKTELADRPLRLDEFADLCRVLGQDPSNITRTLTVPSADHEQRFQELLYALHVARRTEREWHAEGERVRARRQAADQELADFVGELNGLVTPEEVAELVADMDLGIRPANVERDG